MNKKIKNLGYASKNVKSHSQFYHPNMLLNKANRTINLNRKLQQHLIEIFNRFVKLRLVRNSLVSAKCLEVLKS